MHANTALVIVFTLCILGPCGVMGAAVFASITALGRNPSAAGKIFTAMTISFVFAMSIAVIGLLVSFQVLTR